MTDRRYLQDRIAVNDELVARPLDPAASVMESPPDSDLYTFTAEFVTDYRVVHARLTIPEARLSDHLNSSAVGIDLRPHSAVQTGSGAHTDLPDSHAHLMKARVLFVIPLAEPQRPNGVVDMAWKSTVQRRCWVGTGPYRIVGMVHIEESRDPAVALRLLDKRFLPLTDVTITDAGGNPRTYPVIILNRHRLDLIALTA